MEILDDLIVYESGREESGAGRWLLGGSVAGSGGVYEGSAIGYWWRRSFSMGCAMEKLRLRGWIKVSLMEV